MKLKRKWNLERLLHGFCLEIGFQLRRMKKKELWKWKKHEVTRKVPTDNSKSAESECKLVCWFKKNLYSFRLSKITKWSSSSHKIQSHKRNVTSLSKMWKRRKGLRASRRGELSFSRKEGGNNKHPTGVMDPSPLFYNKIFRVRAYISH